MSVQAKKILADRAKRRGPFALNLRAAGLIYTALIESRFGIKLPYPIGPDLVALMMVGKKIQRASTNFSYDADNYDDTENYISLARTEHPKNENKSNPVQLDSKSNRNRVLRLAAQPDKKLGKNSKAGSRRNKKRTKLYGWDRRTA